MLGHAALPRFCTGLFVQTSTGFKLHQNPRGRGRLGDGWMMLMMVVAMVMAMAKIFAFRFYISKLPINRLRGRYVTFLYTYFPIFSNLTSTSG